MMPISETGPRQLPLDLGHEISHAEDDFLVGTGNAMAHARILAWPHWPDGVTLLIGPAASGKSHLARIFADRSGAILVSPATIGDVASGEGTQPVAIEDVDRLSYDEHDLFHLLNQAMRGERTVLLSAREDIAHWPLQTDDVRSRVRRAPVFRLEVSDDIELSQMFVKLFGDRQIRIDPKVIGYVVPRMERSPEEAAALVDLMDRLALAKGSAITRTIASEALALRHGAIGLDPQQDWDAETDE
ncbi:P-loop NTPase family protein [Devosia sp. CAU 1758]